MSDVDSKAVTRELAGALAPFGMDIAASKPFRGFSTGALSGRIRVKLGLFVWLSSVALIVSNAKSVCQQKDR